MMKQLRTEELLLPVPEELTRQKCLQYCQQFLGDGWTQTGENDIEIGRISGGLSNLLYLVALNDRVPLSEGVPRKVLIRTYGQILYENPETVVTDSVIYALLAEKGLGPRLWGVFTGGRVEQFIKGSRPLHRQELPIPEISQECGRIMARFHKLRMPLVKEPRFLFDTMTRYLDEALNNISFASGHKYSKEHQEKLQTVLSFGLANEYESLKHIMRQVDSPVVFCHNDLQEGNVLYMEDQSTGVPSLSTPQTDVFRPKLVAIDFEYAAYNYRGFDIANHFVEWCYGYQSDTPPFFEAAVEDYPNREKQLIFLRAYIDEFDFSVAEKEGLEDKLLLEVSVFVLASHLLWSLWCIVQAHMSEIEFDYMSYALARLEHYFKQKRELVDSGKLPLQ